MSMTMEETSKGELSWKALNWYSWGPIFQNEKVGETYKAGRLGEKDDN